MTGVMADTMTVAEYQSTNPPPTTHARPIVAGSLLFFPRHSCPAFYCAHQSKYRLLHVIHARSPCLVLSTHTHTHPMLSSYRDPRRSTTTYAAALESLENDILDWNGEVLKRDYPLAYALLASDPAPESYIHIRLRALLRLHPTTKLDSALLSTHPGSNQFKLILPARPPLVYHTFDHRHGPRLLRYLNANQEGVREERDDIWSWAVWAKSNGWRLLQEYIVVSPLYSSEYQREKQESSCISLVGG